MKRLLLALLFLLPTVTFAAPFTVPQGGTGQITFPANSFLTGNGNLPIQSTSSPYFSSFSFGSILSGIVSVLHGGTGLGVAPTYGQVLVGNAGGGYTLTATSSLGLITGVSSFNTRTGAVTLTSGDVTGALGFTPYNATNPSGYISNITGLITAGTNITLSGAGTSGSPYVINASGSGGGASSDFTYATNYGIISAATTTPIWGQAGLFASSSSAYPTLAVDQSGAGPSATFMGGNVGIGTTSPYIKLGVTGGAYIGPDGLPAASIGTTLNSYTTDLNTNTVANSFQAVGPINAAGSAQTLNFSLNDTGNNTSGTLIGVNGIAQKSGTGGATSLTGIQASPRLTGAATVGTLNGFMSQIRFNNASAVVTSAINFSATAPSTGATVTSAYGFKTVAMKVAGVATGYGFASDGTTDLNYFLGSTGIGTLNPGAKLTVVGSTTSTGVTFQTQNSSLSPLVTGLDNGNFGIGTTTPDAPLTFGQTTGDKIHLFANSSTASYGLGVNSGELNIFAGTSGNINFRTNGSTGTSNLYIATAGNVGVGTTTPNTKLQVNTASLATSLSTSNAFRISSIGNTSSLLDLGLLQTGSGGGAYLQGNNLANTASNIYLNPYGASIAIGTTSPSPTGTLTVVAAATNIPLAVFADPTNGRGFRVFTSDFSSVSNIGSQLAMNFGAGTGNTYAAIDTTVSGSSAAGNLVLQSGGGKVGIGTTTPGSLLSLAGISNFTTATSTFYSTGGINLTGGGCFAVNGTCVGTGAGTVTSVTGTYPIVSSGGTTPVISLAFGTTTANTWSQTQTFSLSPVFSTLGAGTVNATAAGTIYNTATTSLSVGSPLTVTGTIGALIGGTNSTINCQTASGSQAGCLSSADWTTFNGKQAAGNYITALTGDATASGPGSVALTLATVNSNVGTFNTLTVNAKGLVTAASNTSYQAPLTFTYPLVNTANTISLAFGTTTSNTWAGTQTFTNTIKLSSLATPAGTFLASDASGNVIATTSPTGSNFFTNSGAFTYLSTGTQLGIGTTSPFAQFSIVNIASSTQPLSFYTSGMTSTTTTYNTNGTYSYSIPAGTYAIKCTVVGAAGGGAANGLNNTSGGGGGSSACSNFAVGPGGGGGSNNNSSGNGQGKGGSLTGGGIGGLQNGGGNVYNGGTGATVTGTSYAARFGSTMPVIVGQGGTGANNNGNPSPGGTGFVAGSAGGFNSNGGDGGGSIGTPTTATGGCVGDTCTAGTDGGGGVGGNPTGANGVDGSVIVTAYVASATSTTPFIQAVTKGGFSLMIGTTSPAAALVVDSPFQQPLAIFAGFIGTIKYVFEKIDQIGHFGSGGPTPTVTSCGTSPTIVGDDQGGTVTLGTASPSSCVINFAGVYNQVPYCVETDSSTGNDSAITAISQTSFTVALTTGVSSVKIYYMCKYHIP